MVLACESIFSRTCLDGRPQNLHTFSKVNLKYTKRTFPVGQARCSFHLPHSYNLQILLPGAMGQAPMLSPVCFNPFMPRHLLKSVVCFGDTYENILEIKLTMVKTFEGDL